MSLSHTDIEKPSEVTHRWLSTRERGVCNQLILSLSLLSVLYKVQPRCQGFSEIERFSVSVSLPLRPSNALYGNGRTSILPRDCCQIAFGFGLKRSDNG